MNFKVPRAEGLGQSHGVSIVLGFTVCCNLHSLLQCTNFKEGRKVYAKTNRVKTVVPDSSTVQTSRKNAKSMHTRIGRFQYKSLTVRINLSINYRPKSRRDERLLLMNIHQLTIGFSDVNCTNTKHGGGSCSHCDGVLLWLTRCP